MVGLRGLARSLGSPDHIEEYVKVVEYLEQAEITELVDLAFVGSGDDLPDEVARQIL